MKENWYQYCEEKASRYARLPKFSNEALQHCPGSLSGTLPGSRRVTTCPTVRRRDRTCAINGAGPMQGSRIRESGRRSERNSVSAGRPKLSRDGLKSNMLNFSPAMRPFINGSTVLSENGSRSWYDLIAGACRAAILTGIKSFMSPTESPSKNGPNRFFSGDASVIGRPIS